MITRDDILNPEDYVDLKADVEVRESSHRCVGQAREGKGKGGGHNVENHA
jgi:hypothetical protein